MLYQEPDEGIDPILATKSWLESKEPPELPITENFPEMPKFLKDQLLKEPPCYL